MSEYQYFAFRAIDGPVSEANLKFMRKQSSRAEITAWAFENEYEYGDFRGNQVEMLRRGYDFHFHYANFGVRKLMIRLPNGLPDPKAAKDYFDGEELYFLKDKKGPGGILCLEPYLEPDTLDELWDLDSFPDSLLPLRAEILEGDLRPLYLAYLAVAGLNADPDEEKGPPIPAGLDKLTRAQQALAELYGLEEGLIAAAARHGPPLRKSADSRNQCEEWLARQSEAAKNTWLAQLMGDPHSSVRRELLAECQKSVTVASWPTTRPGRTIAELEAEARVLQQELDAKRAEKAARQRTKKLAEMAAAPEKTLRETEQLVKQRSTDSYREAAELLADLRTALAGSKKADLPEEHARKLRKDHPTLKLLVSELRGKGFLKK